MPPTANPEYIDNTLRAWENPRQYPERIRALLRREEPSVAVWRKCEMRGVCERFPNSRRVTGRQEHVMEEEVEDYLTGKSRQ